MMLTSPPDDHLIRLNIDQLGTLDEYSHQVGSPLLIEGPFSVTLWFQTVSWKGKRVLANLGNREIGQIGWSIFLQDSYLVFQIQAPDARASQVCVRVSQKTNWHHLAGILDIQKKAQQLFLDGRLAASMDFHHGKDVLNAVSKHPQKLLIGGYTDPAGGHYDHTFGRDGSGWIDDFCLYARALLSSEVEAFVDSANQPPIARFEAFPNHGEAPIEAHFDASSSEDADGHIQYFFWELGDGHRARGKSLSHKYRYAGRYTARLTVVDDGHASASTTRKLSFAGERNPLTITPVFVNRTEGHACYRIPSIIRAANGDLIAFAEGRVESCSDSTGTIHLVAKRSMDNGRTWEPLQVIARNLVDDKEHVIQHASPVVDEVFQTGLICLVYNKSEHNEWQLAEGQGVVRVACLFSDDHGMTWSKERDITLQVHRPYNPDYIRIYPHAALPENRTYEWRNQRPTLSHAIQLRGTEANPSTRGRLFYAGSFIPKDAGIFNAHNYIFWSNDLGDSWQIGGINDGLRQDGSSAQGLNEASAVELENGAVMINSRNYQNGEPVGRRAVTIVHFDQRGEAFFQPTYHDETLVCPTVQASILRYTCSDQMEYGGKSRLLFSNPNHPRARYNLSVRLSYDEGQTWSICKVIDPGPSAYSDLVVQADNRIGLLYEHGNQGGIAYVNFTLDWLTDGKDSLAPSDNIGKDK